MMKPFGSVESCPKCGFNAENANVSYAPGKTGFEPPEHLDRQCGQCGFIWMEACVDSKKEAKP